MKLNTAIATSCIVLALGTWSAAYQAGQTGAPAGGTVTSPAPPSGSGDPSTHGTTDKAGQSPQPIGTGGTAVDQGKGSKGRPTNGTSDKKGKRKPKHQKGDQPKDGGSTAR